MRILLLTFVLIALDFAESNINTIVNYKNQQKFSVERKNMATILPDSLGGKAAKGFAVIEMIFNKNGKVKAINLMKLKISAPYNIDYFYPAKLRNKETRFIPFLYDYARNLTIKCIINK